MDAACWPLIWKCCVFLEPLDVTVLCTEEAWISSACCHFAVIVYRYRRENADYLQLIAAHQSWQNSECSQHSELLSFLCNWQYMHFYIKDPLKKIISPFLEHKCIRVHCWHERKQHSCLWGRWVGWGEGTQPKTTNRLFMTYGKLLLCTTTRKQMACWFFSLKLLCLLFIVYSVCVPGIGILLLEFVCFCSA